MGVNMKNISLSELLKHPEYKESKAVLPIIVGTDTNNKLFIQDLCKMPHWNWQNNVFESCDS